MSEKTFIDSRDQIALDLGESTLILPILHWLDTHPEAVPSSPPTPMIMADIDRSVVPDPKPKKLPTAPGAVVKMRGNHRWVFGANGHWVSTDGSVLLPVLAQEIADRHGFKVINTGVAAPGDER